MQTKPLIRIKTKMGIFAQYSVFTKLLFKVYSQILDPEEKEAIRFRFIEGYSRKETIMFIRRGDAASTVDRRIDAGIESVVNSLKLTGFYDLPKEEF